MIPRGKWLAVRRRRVLIIVTTSLLVRLVAIPFVGDRTIPYEWGTLSANLVAGRGYAYFSVNAAGEVVSEFLAAPLAVLPSAYMPPLYAFAVAGMLDVLGSEMAAATAISVMQAFLASGTAWLIYRASLVLFGSAAAMWALSLYCFFPLAIYSSAQVSAVTLYVFLGQVVLTCLVVWQQDCRRRAHLLFAGIASGWLLLARGESTVVIGLFVVWIAWMVTSERQGSVRGRGSIGTLSTVGLAIRACAWFLIPALCIACPWAIRNYTVFQQPTPLTISAGYNLWQGQNAQATGIHGSSVLPRVAEDEALARQVAQIPPSAAYEVMRDSAYLHSGLDSLISNPLRSVGLGFRKAFMYWSGLYPGVPIDYPGAQSLLVVVPWLLVVAMALFGVWAVRRQFREVALFYGYLAVNTLVIMLFFVMPRYNLTILPVVVIFAGVVLARLSCSVRLKWRHKWVPRPGVKSG